MRGRARRLAMPAAVAGFALLALSGCTVPDGIDRDLTGEWGSMPEPVRWSPEVGTCHPGSFRTDSPLFAYQPVDCQLEHVTETVHIGEFEGGAADRVTPPPPGSPEWRDAFAECDRAAAGYLGADFRHGHLWLGVSVPSVEGWEGGARWFRCELEPFDAFGGFPKSRLGSLIGALEVDSELRLGCFQATFTDDDEAVEEMERRDCDEPHNAEFVGVWHGPDVPYLDADDEDAAERVQRGCRGQVAEYADVPVDRNLVFRTGTIAFWMSEQEWDNGDRGFRCLLWQGRELTESLAGAGTAGLPIR